MNSSNNFIVADTAAPLNHFAKNGFYQIGNRVFNHKIMALQHASQTAQDVHWNFNDSVFDALDWNTSSGVSLFELYRIRAQQLRNKYRYLVLCWSGGADSTTILDTFLDNNILLDELVIIWPQSQTQGKYKPNKSTSNYNALSEWDFTIRPRLDLLKTTHPNLKVTYIDVMSQPNANEYQDDTVLIAEKHCYFTIQRCRDLDGVLRERTERYGSVAAMLGVQPAEVVLIKDIVAARFIDDFTNPLSKSDYTLQGWPRNIEFFYWTPDLPDIVKEQSHVLLKYLQHNKQARSLVPQMILDTNYASLNSFDPEIYRSLRKKLFYPNYPLDTFQVNKPTMSHAHNEWYDWFLSHPHAEQYLKPWESAVRSHQNLINEKFLKKRSDGTTDGYRAFFSKFYVVGRLDN
jgi:hypothetical protein